MAARSGLTWRVHPNVLAANAIAYGRRIVVSVQQFARTLAEAAEREARLSAPWRDVTGAARANLQAFVEYGRSGQARMVLAHGVEYGIWLEVKQAGRWGIVTRTLARLAPTWAAFLRGLGF